MDKCGLLYSHSTDVAEFALVIISVHGKNVLAMVREHPSLGQTLCAHVFRWQRQ